MESYNKNKTFFCSQVFFKRVESAMERKKIDYEELKGILEQNGYIITKSNLKIYVKQRVPNVNFLIALASSLDVSIDYLLGTNDDAYFFKEFDYEYDSWEYGKYLKNYSIYFYATGHSKGNELIEAKLSIFRQNGIKVRMSIPIENEMSKTYSGELFITKNGTNAFINLKGIDCVDAASMVFYNPQLNKNSVQLISGVMVSVSTGDTERNPVMSRFILISNDIQVNESDEEIIKSYLNLNGEFIYITSTSLDAAIESLVEICGEIDVKRVRNRLASAFEARTFYAIEENYILNTIRNDFGLSMVDANRFLAKLRLKSMSFSNNKVDRSADRDLYYMLSRKK